MGDREGEGAAYGNLGNALYSLSDHRKAIEYHEKALKFAIEIGNCAVEGGAYGNLAMLTIHWVTIEKPLSIMKSD